MGTGGGGAEALRRLRCGLDSIGQVLGVGALISIKWMDGTYADQLADALSGCDVTAL